MTADLQKASLWKRISAGLFDGILLCVLAVGIATVLSMILNYDGYNQELNAAYARYEKQYGVVFDMTEAEYSALTEQEQQNYMAAYEALVADQEVLRVYNIVANLTLLITTFGIMLAVLVLEFAVPLFFKNGQTLGKKIFSICVVRKDGIRVSAVQLFIRTVLGKFTIEIMAPVYIALLILFGAMGIDGTLILALLLLAQLVSMAVSRTNAMLHDRLSGTAVVDISTQMIFRDTDELIAYTKKLHAEEAARRDY